MFYESASYKQYVAVNQRFADVIVSNYREGDISESDPHFYINELNGLNSLGE